MVTSGSVQCHPGLTTFLISDIPALWRSGMSARETKRSTPKRSTFETVGLTDTLILDQSLSWWRLDILRGFSPHAHAWRRYSMYVGSIRMYVCIMYWRPLLYRPIRCPFDWFIYMFNQWSYNLRTVTRRETVKWIFDTIVSWQLGGSCSFFFVKVKTQIWINLSGRQMQQFMLMEKLAFCFWRRGAALAHKERGGNLPPLTHKIRCWYSVATNTHGSIFKYNIKC